MPRSKSIAAVAAVAGLLLAVGGPAHAGRSERTLAKISDADAASDLHSRISRSYESERRLHRRTAQKPVKRTRTLAYPNSPWGPFAGPPGLF